MEFETCAVCGRSILRGERSFEYVDADRAEHLVCPLCKPRAEEIGWLPAAFAAAAPPPAPRRQRGATALRERLVRAVSPPAPDDQPPAIPPTPLEVFNASSEVRKVAGLRRSLGEPRVCVRPEGSGGGEVVIVAWDLSWYRWTVRGGAVKQVAKGNEISELPLSDRDWNASAGADGTLTRA
ncbi:MAG: hypothetical protein QOI10_774 [Solirubrobacterales bacterium]|nr:hypothetical protein [Solirubrobacterales bacterium]